MIELYKSGDSMSIRTSCTDAEDFRQEFCEMLSSMIDKDCYQGDWEFQLSFWLPQFCDIYMSLKGVDIKGIMRFVSSGMVYPKDLDILFKKGKLEVVK